MKLTIAALAMSALLATGAFAGSPPTNPGEQGASIVVHENPNPVQVQNSTGQGQLPAVQNQGAPGQTRASINFTRK